MHTNPTIIQIFLCACVLCGASTLPAQKSAYYTRYFLNPTAYNLYQGEGYYQNALLFFNRASYGFTDHFSASIGTAPLFLVGESFTPVWVSSKLSTTIQENRSAVALGGLLGGFVGENIRFGFLYGIGTLGSRDRNTSLGIVYGYSPGEWEIGPAITWSGMYRINNRWLLQTENIYVGFNVDDPVFLFSAGARWIRPKISLEFGLGRTLFGGSPGELIALPWVSMVAPFSRRS